MGRESTGALLVFASAVVAAALGCGDADRSATGLGAYPINNGAGADAGSHGGGGGGGGGGTGGVDGAAPGFAVRVSGNTLVDGAGKALRLFGVNHSGTEYACAQGYAIFDGPHDDALAAVIASWHVNTVRVPLNEDCWLGLNGVAAQYSGQVYRDAIAGWVSTLHAHGLYAIIDLHWAAPGANVPQAQQPMADADHAPAFWGSVADAFKGDPAVVFDLFNEPFLDATNASGDPWTCWRDGCTVTKPVGIGGTYKTAGMQSLLDAVRATGATNVAMMGGLDWANDLSGWLAHAPSDPAGQLAASYHNYNFTTCNQASCWDATLTPVAQTVPVITGEIGEDDCGHGYIDGYMAWADSHGVSYLGWAFDPWDCKKAPALVSDWSGTPTPFGQGFKDHLAAVTP